MSAVRLLVVVPCRDEADSVQETLERIPRVIAGVEHVAVVVIDDGSVDDTALIARQAGAQVIRISANRGLGFVFRTGVAEALKGGYDLMATIDGDGQFAPEELPRVVEPVLHGKFDMVTGSRFLPESIRDGMPIIKRLGNVLMARLITRLTGRGRRYWDVSCGFRCYSAEALIRMNLYGDFTYTQETFLSLAAKGLQIGEVPISVVYFVDRKSRVAASLVRYAIRTVAIILRAHRDHHPLRFFWGLATPPLVGSAAFGVAFVLNYLSTGAFSGYLFAGFSAGALFVIGLSLLLAGVLAEMIGRNMQNQDLVLYYLKLQEYTAARERLLNMSVSEISSNIRNRI